MRVRTCNIVSTLDSLLLLEPSKKSCSTIKTLTPPPPPPKPSFKPIDLTYHGQETSYILDLFDESKCIDVVQRNRKLTHSLSVQLNNHIDDSFLQSRAECQFLLYEIVEVFAEFFGISCHILKQRVRDRYRKYCRLKRIPSTKIDIPRPTPRSPEQKPGFDLVTLNLDNSVILEYYSYLVQQNDEFAAELAHKFGLDI